MNNGHNTLFWEDVWLGDTPFKLTFPKLYGMCSKSDALVADYWLEGVWDIRFKRSLGELDDG